MPIRFKPGKAHPKTMITEYEFGYSPVQQLCLTSFTTVKGKVIAEWEADELFEFGLKCLRTALELEDKKGLQE